jgi:hypothetical protein
MKNESWKFLKIGKRESKNERAMRYWKREMTSFFGK